MGQGISFSRGNAGTPLDARRPSSAQRSPCRDDCAWTERSHRDHPWNRRVTISVRLSDYNPTENGVRIMPLNELLPGSNPARDDVQQTDFGYDVVSRYICNNWQEIAAAQGPGAYPFDVIVIG